MKMRKRNECVVLPLVLKTKWYRMIESGEKREEYRNATPYWNTRLANWINRHVYEDKPAVVEFRLGYAADAPRMAFDLYGLGHPFGSGCTRPEWGEPRLPHWSIRLDERVELVDGTDRILASRNAGNREVAK